MELGKKFDRTISGEVEVCTGLVRFCSRAGMFQVFVMSVATILIFCAGTTEAQLLDDLTLSTCRVGKECRFGYSAFGFSGTATVRGDGIAEPDPDVNTQLNWTNVYMSCSDDPILGSISISLDGSEESIATIIPLDPPVVFPAKNRVEFFFSINAPMFSLVPLVSVVPAVLEYTINSESPAGEAKLLSPVDFYVRGDPMQDPVFTITEATVIVKEKPPVPTLSEWGLVAIALLLLTTAAWMLWRKRRAAAT